MKGYGELKTKVESNGKKQVRIWLQRKRERI